MHILAKATHNTLHGLIFVAVVLGVSNAFVRSVNLLDVLPLQRLGNREYRFALTYWQGIAANTLMLVAFFHRSAALLHITFGATACCVG